jgi:hypothetical protein
MMDQSDKPYVRGDNKKPNFRRIPMEDRVFIISVLLAIMTLIGSVTFYHYSQLQAMKLNIENAIVKGIDPVAVRCAYANERDVICVAHAASSGSPPPRK